MSIRRLGGGPPLDTAASQPAAPRPTPAATPASRPPPAPAASTPSTRTAPRALAGAAGLPPEPDVDISNYGHRERRDDAYWEAHPIRSGTYQWDAVVSKVVEWGDGGIDVTFRILDWNSDERRPGEHHDRTLKWEQSRPKLVERMALGGEEGEKAQRGFKLWRRDLVGAYTACGWPEDSWPKNGTSPVPPWWLFFVHTCPDGIVVPVVLTIKVVVRPQAAKWPTITEVRQVYTSGENPRPFQATLPYCVPASLAEEHRWPIAAMKWFGDKAEVALPDRNAIPFPHAGLMTYKDL